MTEHQVIDYGKFAARLASRTDRWSLLVEFQREWGFSGQVDSGIAITAAERGIVGDDAESFAIVPEALRQWCALPQNPYAAREDGKLCYGTQLFIPPGRWPDPEEFRSARAAGLAEDRTPENLGIFAGAYECDWAWAYYEREAAANPDPPVYHVVQPPWCAPELKALLETEEGLTKRLAAHSMSEWLLAWAMFHLPGAMLKHYSNWLLPEQRAEVRARFRPLGFLPWLDSSCHDLYGGRDVIVSLRRLGRQYLYEEMAYDDDEFEIVARTEQALDEALALVGIRS